MGSATKILNSDAEHIRTQSQIDAARKTQKSGNERRGVEANVSNQLRLIGNRRIMDATGDEVAAITENIGRNLDAATSGTFQSRIAAAEQMGAIAAGASAAGVGGSSVDLYKSTLALGQAMKEEAAGRAINSDKYAAGRAVEDTYTNGVNALDNTQAIANLDFTQYVDHKKMSYLTKHFAFVAAATATYFGGPQAGNAVLDAVQANQDFKNGDFASGERRMDSAVQGGLQGYKNFTSLGGNGKAGEAWGKGAWDSVKNIFL